MKGVVTVAQEETSTTFKTRFTWTIRNFSSIKDTKKKHFSDVFVDGCGYKWRILIFPKGVKDDYLSIFLDVADSANLPDGWGRYAQFSLSVLNQEYPIKGVTKAETKHQFNAETRDRGFTSFIRLDILYGHGKGFLVNDTLIFEAEVCTDSKKETGSLELKNQKARTVATICPNCAVEGEQSLDLQHLKLKNEVFDEMSQSPHYAPLVKYSDIVRKGMMIGLDIAFVNLSKEIWKLEDPQSLWSKMDGFTEQLMELEEMGYNVEKLRERLETLDRLAKRDKEAKEEVEKFKEEMKEHENAISELKAKIQIRKKDSVDALKEFESTVKTSRK